MMRLRYFVLVVAMVAVAASTPLQLDDEEPEGDGGVASPATNGSLAGLGHSPDVANVSVEAHNETMDNVTLASAMLFGDDLVNGSSAHHENGTSSPMAAEGNVTHTAKRLDDGSEPPEAGEGTPTDATGEPGADEKTVGSPTTEKSAAGLKDDDDLMNTVTVPASLGALTPTPVRATAPPSPTVLQLHPAPGSPIRFRSGEPDDWQPYVDDLTAFLRPYRKEAQERNVHCDFEKERRGDQACRFDLVYLGPSCTEQNHFGYGIGKPCVILSPADIPGWVPAAYDNDTDGVPDEVQRLMRIFNANFLFVTCEGESESDRANVGPMAYLPPYQGFPSYFFPHAGDAVPSYVAPLMAIEFLNPANGTLIHVACKAWAKNVGDIPLQSALHFSLQVN